MKKVLALLLCLTLCLGMFAGCTETVNNEDSDEIKIVTTIFPIYDWTMNMLGDEAENYSVSMLIDNGVDMHSFQPTTADMVELYSCDVFIYVGGESDSWVSDLLANSTNTDMIAINLVDILGDSVVYEELVEGMEETEHSHSHDDEEEDHDHSEEEEEEEHVHDEDCDHTDDEDHDHDEEDHDHDEEDHDHDDEEDHDHDEEIDEHVWLSIQNAQVICAAIAETLSSIDSTNSATYSANLSSYVAQLKALDSEYAEMISSSSRDTVLFADRFPFRYFVDDYNLTYYAAFSGCSAETEASFETIAFLAGKVDELDLDIVLTVEGTTHKIAETVVSVTATQDQTILAVNAMETVSADDIQAGASYISIMQENLEIFKAALN